MSVLDPLSPKYSCVNILKNEMNSCIRKSIGSCTTFSGSPNLAAYKSMMDFDTKKRKWHRLLSIHTKLEGTLFPSLLHACIAHSLTPSEKQSLMHLTRVVSR